MKKIFTVYGNCQAIALAKTLLENEAFTDIYEYMPLKCIQWISEENLSALYKTAISCDLFIYQHVSETYGLPELSSKNVLSHVKNGCRCISFPSLYCNGYFPHLDVLRPTKSILNLVHDYVVLWGYLLKLRPEQIKEIMESPDFYPEEVCKTLLQQSFEALANRERVNKTDLTASAFIMKSYQTEKLYTQFNHPRSPVFIYLADNLFELLEIENNQDQDEGKGKRDYLRGVVTPVYQSIYNNLELSFPEEFSTYRTIKGFMNTIDVIEEFFKTYDTLDKDFLVVQVRERKPFVLDLYKRVL